MGLSLSEAKARFAGVCSSRSASGFEAMCIRYAVKCSEVPPGWYDCAPRWTNIKVPEESP